MKHNRTKKYCGLAVATLLLGGALSASAATPKWNGNGADDNWITGANWSPGAPVAGNSLIFEGPNRPTPYNDFAAGTAFGGLTFSASAIGFTLGGNAIELNGNLLNSSASPQEIDLAIVITNGVTFDTGGADVTVGGMISSFTVGTNVYPGSLTKLGTSTLILSNKTYTGGTTVSNGLLVVNNDNGNYTMSGGSLNLNYGSYWSAPTIAFTTNSSVGTDNGRIDFAGSIGTAGYTWTKTGSGTMNMVYWGADPTAVVKASAIDVAAGTLGCIINGGTIAQWGSTNVPITVEVGAALSVNDGNLAPNPITLQGGDGGGPGTLRSDRVNASTGNLTNTVAGKVTLNGDSTIGTFGGIFRISGNITGPGGLSTVGAGGTYSQNTLVLAGTNTYGGNTTISTGLVQLASASALPGGPTNGNVQMNNTCTLDLNGFNASLNGLADDSSGAAKIDNTRANPVKLTLGGNNQSGSFAGPVKNTGGGALSIVKVGSGLVTLLGANTHSGSNVVSGGKLELNIPTGVVTGTGPVVVADGAELSLHLRVAGSSLKATGASFGTSGATTLDIDVANFGNPPLAVINATGGTGVLSANGTITVNIAGNGNIMSPGQFPLIKYTTRSGNGTFVLGALPASVTAQIVTNVPNKSIDLLVLSAQVTKWVGNVNNLWDIGTTKNWAVMGVATNYGDGVGVMFDDTALTNNVDLTTTLSPVAALVQSTNTYTFGGAGALISGDVILSGPGTLTLLTANTYNNTVIAGGTLQVGGGGPAASLGGGNVTLEGSLVFNRSDDYDVLQGISGAGGVVKLNTNRLTLSGANTYSGGTVINQGVVQMGNASGMGSPGSGTAWAVLASGAALDINGKLLGGTNPILVSGSGTGGTQGAIYNTGGGTCIGCGSIGVGTIQLTGDAIIGSDGNMWDVNGGIVGGGFNLTKIGNASINLRAAAVSSPAQFTIGGGGIYYMRANCVGTAATTVVITNNAWMNTWDQNNWSGYTIGNNFIIGAGGGQIRNSQGAWYGHANYDTYTGNITLNDTLTLLNTSTYSGSPNAAGVVTHGTMTLNGAISGAGGLIASAANSAGGNVITLNGVNTYTGPTTVTGGTLALTTGQRGGGAYTVEDGAVLDVGLATGFTNLPMSSLTLGTGGGATLVLSRLTSLSTSSAPITATNLTVAGVNAVAVPGSAYTTPGQYPLIKYTGTVGGGGSFSLTRGVPGYISNNVAKSSIDLVVPGDTPVLWAGNAGNAWDIATTANWLYQSLSTTYEQTGLVGDAVTFDDSSLVNTVNVTTAVSPAVMVVTNNTKTYTLGGLPISGATTVLKEGSGTLVLSNANSFGGGTFIQGGTVRLGNDSGVNNVGGSVFVASGATFDLNNYNPSGITINASGAGVGGNGAIVDNYSPSAGNTRGPGTINMTGDLWVGGTNQWSLRNGAHILNCPTNGYSLIKVGPNMVDFAGATVSTNLGDIVILRGTFSHRNANSSLGNPAKHILVGAGATLNFNGNPPQSIKPIICTNTATITANSAGQTIANPITLDSGTVTLDANYNNTVTFTNVISGAGGILINYNSGITFSAANTYTGGTEVRAGPNGGPAAYLKLSGNGSVANSPSIYLHGNGPTNYLNGVILDASARTDSTLTLINQSLRGDTGSSVKGNVIAGSGATVTPGGIGYIQTMAFSNAVTFQAGSTCVVDINTDTLTNDLFIVTGALTYGGTLQINHMGTNGFAGGQSFKLFNAASYANSFATVTTNTGGQFVTWDLSQLPVSGTLLVASVTSSSIPTLANSLSGNTLTLSWPPDHLGWRLLVQTNHLDLGISTNYLDWGTVAGSASTTSVPITIDSAKRTEFYRLTYP